MKPSRKTELSDALHRVAAPPKPRSADAFWAEFRARAAMTDQVDPARTDTVAGPWHSWRLGVATAAAAIIICAIAVFQIPDETVVASAQSADVDTLSEVEEVEVFADYSSVLIVEDQQNGGTVIWVAGTDVASVP